MEIQAFEKAVLENKDRVHSYATLMLRDPAEAQDVAQEALVRLWQHRRKVDGRAAKPWLVRTVYNLCIDRIRQRRVRAEVANGEAVMSVEADVAPDPGRLAESGEMGRVIRRCLDSLSETDRAVVVMREIQGLAYDEIASILGLPLGTLKARLHRARERLRSRLARIGVKP